MSLPIHSAVILARLDGDDISLADLRAPDLWQGLEALIEQAIRRRLVLREAEHRGLQVPPETLQQAADRYRVNLGLQRAEDTLRWLKSQGLVAEDLEAEARYQELERQLESMIAVDRVERFFLENRSSFDAVILTHLVVADEEQARAFIIQIQAGNIVFEEAARKHSIDSATAHKGGFLGEVRRGSAHPEVESKIFSARRGEIVGPFKIGAGWELIKTIEVCPAQLNDSIRQEIASLLFAEWLEQARAQARVEKILQTA